MWYQVRSMEALKAVEGLPPASLLAGSSRVKLIKNLLLERDILNLVASCEFAMNLNVQSDKARVNYANLLERIDRSLEILKLRYGEGYSENLPLVMRLHTTREDIVNYSSTQRGFIDVDAVSSSSTIGGAMDAADTGAGQGVESDDLEKIKGVAEENIPSLSFIVREDGSVDWDEALASTREAARFGTELWERLNGKEEEEGIPSIGELLAPASVKSEVETEEVKRLRGATALLEEGLATLSEADADFKRRLRLARSDGHAISSDDLASLRRTEEKEVELRKLLTLTQLDLDMERICVYLEQDLSEGGGGGVSGSTADSPMDLKLVVAEVTLIERQLMSVLAGLPRAGEIDEEVLNGEPNMLVGLVEEEELAILTGKVADLKGRLGIDATGGKPVDWGTIGVLSQETADKLREGLAFYGDGTRMLISDIQYAWKLLLKAAQGSTLKPREVNTMRRTGKDVLTLVPFTIILLIPLSPVGHVLVFSFIQRFFPDFFPSCYTEKRLNLRRLYAEIKTQSDDEILGSRGSASPKGQRSMGFMNPLDGLKGLFDGAAQLATNEEEY